MQRLMPDKLGRLYHNELYQRMVTFAQEYTPEFPAEPVVNHWLERFYKGDDRLHILVSYDTVGGINGHAVIDIQEAYGQRVVMCYQVHHLKADKASLEEGLEYLAKLRESVGAIASMFTVVKGVKAYERYGYMPLRTVLIQYTPTEGIAANE